MAIITEDYVSFETAKLLKEKEFDIICDKVYNEVNQRRCPIEYEMNLEGKGYYLCPTLQMTMKWLRETHDIDVSIVPLRSHKEYLPRVEANVTCHDGIPCKKYEEACEASIKYCLENLI